MKYSVRKAALICLCASSAFADMTEKDLSQTPPSIIHYYISAPQPNNDEGSVPTGVLVSDTVASKQEASELPIETWHKVMDFLDYKEIFALGLSSKKFHAIVTDKIEQNEMGWKYIAYQTTQSICEMKRLWKEKLTAPFIYKLITSTDLPNVQLIASAIAMERTAEYDEMDLELGAMKAESVKYILPTKFLDGNGVNGQVNVDSPLLEEGNIYLEQLTNYYQANLWGQMTVYPDSEHCELYDADKLDSTGNYEVIRQYYTTGNHLNIYPVSSYAFSECRIIKPGVILIDLKTDDEGHKYIGFANIPYKNHWWNEDQHGVIAF